MRLAGKGFDVIAAVEIWAQAQTLKRQAAERGAKLQVEKLDVTDAEDRKEALGWDVEILVNNAGVGEGDSTLDIPAANILRQFEVNVIGPLLLTQRIAKQMIKRGEGRIVWVSRREGLNAIARRWGFTDASNFTRIFRATFDMSPREWREINRRRPH
jgi:NAD(P)-dependent dehydrogenase (short-subunit alcohol dehydrogenase family)